MSSFERFEPAYVGEDEAEVPEQQPIIQDNEAQQPVVENIENPEPNDQDIEVPQDNDDMEIPEPDNQDIEVPQVNENMEIPEPDDQNIEVPQVNEDMEIPEPGPGDQVNRIAEEIEQGFNLGSEEVLRHLVGYLTKKDLLICRQISKIWNTVLCTYPCYPKFQSRLIGKFRDKWYKDVQGRKFDFETTLKWNTLKLNHFAYRRNSGVFKSYWHCAASSLDTLTISNCSLECDGFSFLLDHCPVLRTLNLRSCKLRDFDDIHDTIKRPRIGAPCENPRPIAQGLRNLNVESMCRFEQCFMEYLNARTGSLESITLSKCFQSPLVNEDPIDNLTLSRMAEELLRNMLVLFNINSGTMRKYGLHDNNFQTEMFPLVTPPQPIVIPEMALTLRTPTGGDYTSIVQFLNNCQEIEKLSLRFLGNINTVCIQALVRCCQASLQKLELIVDGNIILTDETSISLDFLGEFPQLQDIQIRDAKKYHPLEVSPFIGGKRSLNDPDHIPGTIQTPVSPSFLQNLPPFMRRLTLDKYIPLESITVSLNAALDSFRGLTKLEVRGPWIHSMDGVVQIIAGELLFMTTLALTNCGLTDVQVTGLDKELVATSRFRLNMPADGHVPARTSINNTTYGIRVQHANLGIQIRNPRLSDLTQLTHLDFSMNALLTNVSLVDSLEIPRLKTLNLSGCIRMKDRSLEYLTLRMPGLEELYVKYCKHMTKRGLNKYLKDNRHIKKVYTTRTTQSDNQVLPGQGNGAPYTLHRNYNDIMVITTSTSDDNAHED